MKLKDTINSLEEMGFLDGATYINVTVVKIGSRGRKSEIFHVHIPVDEAVHFFGELEIIRNTIESLREWHVGRFSFELAYDKPETKREE